MSRLFSGDTPKRKPYDGWVPPAEVVAINNQWENTRRMQTAASLNWETWYASFEDGVFLDATQRLAARQYADARARMGLTEGDYSHG